MKPWEVEAQAPLRWVMRERAYQTVEREKADADKRRADQPSVSVVRR